MYTAKDICGGIVTYHPDLCLLKENLDMLSPQVIKMFVVDNGSSDIEGIQELLRSYPKTEFVSNGENVGIAKALNQLCTLAQQDGFQWILTMDQDSLCQVDMVRWLSAYMDDGRYGIIAPRVEFWDGDRLIVSTMDREKETVEIDACITSGSLTRLSAWKEIGGFDEWFFVDRVDNEFCTHLHVAGYDILRVNRAILHQRAGDMKYIRLPFVGNILLPYYNEERNYYICRNTVYYLRKYHHHIDLTHQILAFIYSQLIKIIFESHRIGTIRSMCKGLTAGMRKQIA